jgi:uncharacterized Tic20 family protein
MNPTGTPMSMQTATPTPDEKNMAMIAHFGQIVVGFLAPLIIYLIKKDESKYVAYHGLQSLYFSLAMMVLMIVTCGLAWPVAVIFNIVAGVKVLNGDDYEYPVVGSMARKSVYGA